jgi:hypothetical protein
MYASGADLAAMIGSLKRGLRRLSLEVNISYIMYKFIVKW